jgi:hypothetical protein
VNHGALGEGAQFGEHADAFVTDVVTVGAIADLAGQEDSRAEVAQVGAAGRAPGAPATGRDEAGGDPVALLQGRDAGTNRFHDTGAFMPPDHREVLRQPHGDPDVLRHDHVARDHVLVRVTHARGEPADEHLAVLGLVDLELLDLPFLMGAPEHSCARLHKGIKEGRPEIGKSEA